MKLTLDGKKFVPGMKNDIQQRVKSFLDKLPLGALMTAGKLAESLSCSLYSLHNRLSSGLSEYRHRDGGRYLYGSRKTIKALNGKNN